MMKQLLVLIGLVLCACSLTCPSQGQYDSQLSTNLKVQLRISSLTDLLSRDCQSYITQYLEPVLSNLSDIKINSSVFSSVNITNINSMSKVNVTIANLETQYLQIVIPRLDITIQSNQVNQSSSSLNVKTRARLTLSAKLVSSATHDYTLQVYFRQLALEFNNSTFSSSYSQQIEQSYLEQVQQQMGSRIGMFLSKETSRFNTQLAGLVQGFFVQNYDLGLNYNYTLQPTFSTDQQLYELYLHGDIHHDYHWTNKSVPRSHLLSSLANEARFLALPEKQFDNLSIRFLVSDRLLSSMWGAQYETSTALDQDIRAHMITLFQQYLNVGLKFNIQTLDKLFNGLVKDTLVNAQEIKQSGVNIRLNATDYPYFNLTADDQVKVGCQMQLSFRTTHNQQEIASLKANVHLHFQFKHLASQTHSSNMQVQQFKITIDNIQAIQNYIIPQAYSSQDVEAVRRSLNAFLYLTSKGLQNTINIHGGLNIEQFLPQISFNSKLGGSKVPLLQLVKSKTQTNMHNKNIETFIDFKQIKDSFQQIVDKLKNYIFTKSDL